MFTIVYLVFQLINLIYNRTYFTDKSTSTLRRHMSNFHTRALEGIVELGPMNKFLNNSTKNEPVCFFYLLKFIILNKKKFIYFFFLVFSTKFQKNTSQMGCNRQPAFYCC